MRVNNYFRISLMSGLYFCFLTVCLLWFFAGVIKAAEHYVVPPGTAGAAPADPYTNWTTAGTNIIEVVNAAMTNTAPRVVWVTNGEYCLTNQIMMTNLITVKSFSGNYSNTLLYAGWPTWTNRCFYVANSGTVDGFTISNGHYWASNDYNGGGGALVSNGAVINNCYFLKNVCSNDGFYVGGGAMYIKSAGGIGRTVVSNCIFFTNSVYRGVDYAYNRSQGGAIYDYGDGASVSFINCTIISNTCYGYGGGGAYALWGPATLYSNCLFAFNIGYYGGAVNGDVVITDCVIRDNTAYERGGACYSYVNIKNSTIVNNECNDGSAIYTLTTGVISNCIIAGNRGSSAIRIENPYSQAPTVVIGCQISNNVATYSSGGALQIAANNSALIKNCYIHHNTNTAVYYVGNVGGGIYMNNAAADRTKCGVINCTIVNNRSGNEGGGIAADGASNYIVNCVIANNTSVSGNYPNVYYGSYAGANSSNFYYSCVVTAAAGILAANQGNITNDPLFKDPNTGNYRLSSRSPCVNTGTNQDWMTNAVDLDGLVRIRYGTVDMGAYEAIYEGTIYKFP